MTNTEMRLAARAAGARFYQVAEPCRYGHVSPRYASNGCCVECLTGKSAKPLTEAMAFVSRRYVLQTVVPVEFTDADTEALEQYLLECLHAFAKARGVATPPYNLGRVAWAREYKRPMRECPF